MQVVYSVVHVVHSRHTACCSFCQHSAGSVQPDELVYSLKVCGQRSAGCVQLDAGRVQMWVLCFPTSHPRSHLMRQLSACDDLGPPPLLGAFRWAAALLARVQPGVEEMDAQQVR
jgi:hypothetical protein